MANEKKEAAPPAPDKAADAPAQKKPVVKLAVAAVVVLLLEGATIGVTMMMSKGPSRAIAEVPTSAPAEAVEHDAEVKLLEAKIINSLSGHAYLYDVQVVVKVADKNKAKVTDLFAERDAELKDQIRTIIASSDPNVLAEPGLETIRRQIAYQVQQVIKDKDKDLIKEVLIPRFTAIRADF